MGRSFAAAMRRAMKLTLRGKPVSAGQAMQKAMTKAIVSSATKALAAPLAGAKSAAARKPRAAAGKPRSVGAKSTTHRQIRNLGAVLQQLRAAQQALPCGRSVRPVIPQGARYLVRTHSGPWGSRDYKLYLPASRTRPRGLVLMLHGCQQTPDDFAVGTDMNAIAEAHGLAVAWPAQTHSDNMASCWNWFRPGDQKRGDGEPALLAGLAKRLMKEFGLGRDAVFVAGLSAGGAMAAILADTYPEVFSAAGIHSGMARGAAHDVISATSAMPNGGVAGRKTPTRARPVRRIVFHGDCDTTVHPSNADMIVRSVVGSEKEPSRVRNRTAQGRGYTCSDFVSSEGIVVLQLWTVKGAGHAWSGGVPRGSYTDPDGPNASAEMMRFFLEKPPSSRHI